MRQYCGDGIVQRDSGEECDGLGRCTEDCQSVPSPTFSVTTVDDTAYEGGQDPAVIRLTLSAPFPIDRTVFFKAHGSATLGTDYTLSVNAENVVTQLTVPAGETQVDLVVTPVVSPTVEGQEQVVITVLEAADLTAIPGRESGRIKVFDYGPSPGTTFYVGPDGKDTNPGTETEPFGSLDYALSQMNAGDTVYLFDGLYTNATYTDDHGPTGDVRINNGVLARIAFSGSPDRWTTIAAYPDGNDVKPVLKYDGGGGIQLASNASYIVIDGLEIYGPNEEINYDWAHDHRWSKENFYTGRGLFTWGPVHHVVVRNCHIHHNPGSGIRFNKADYILVENNTVSNSTWWSTAAESGIVIAIAENIDDLDVVKILYSGNTVYNNWNFMEFCSGVGGPVGNFEGSEEPAYGNCDRYEGGIIDGQGLYVTRNNVSYKVGRMRFENNLAFNNGFGGVVYHKTDRGELVNNVVFMNGAFPGVRNYTGLTINNVNDLLVQNNLIWARDEDDYGLKDNGQIANDIRVHGNYIVGRTELGDDENNTLVEYADAPTLSTIFENVSNLAFIKPNPKALDGPSSPNVIDRIIRDLGLNFRLRSTATDLIDRGILEHAPTSDADGRVRPQWTGVDIGAFEQDACVPDRAGLGPNAETFGHARWSDNASAYVLTASNVNSRGGLCGDHNGGLVNTVKVDVRFDYYLGQQTEDTHGLSYTLLDDARGAACADYLNPMAVAPGLTVTINPQPIDDTPGDDEHALHVVYDQSIEGRVWARVPNQVDNAWHTMHVSIDGDQISVSIDGQRYIGHRFDDPDRPLTPYFARHLVRAWTSEVPTTHRIRNMVTTTCLEPSLGDNCPGTENPQQSDSDYDGLGDQCDP
ncbi:MAG: right-handed parallel beta-helix repeat-containing protein [Myxococcota bacterium]|nr:right-handed parallel beta-helix repeat-containing protein [Myxococcota bacterium]